MTHEEEIACLCVAYRVLRKVLSRIPTWSQEWEKQQRPLSASGKAPATSKQQRPLRMDRRCVRPPATLCAVIYLPHWQMQASLFSLPGARMDGRDNVRSPHRLGRPAIQREAPWQEANRRYTRHTDLPASPRSVWAEEMARRLSSSDLAAGYDSQQSVPDLPPLLRLCAQGRQRARVASVFFDSRWLPGGQPVRLLPAFQDASCGVPSKAPSGCRQPGDVLFHGCSLQTIGLPLWPLDCSLPLRSGLSSTPIWKRF
jgi:hypothetical protein